MEPDQPAERIRNIINSGRGGTADWVEDGAPLEKIASILAAMANGQGGTLLVGVQTDAAKKTAIAGVQSEVKAIDRVLQAALSLKPSLIVPLPRVVQVDQARVVEMQIPQGMPHVYAVEGRYLIRSGQDNQPLDPYHLRKLFIQRGEISFEGEVAFGSRLDDIDWEKATSYAKSLDGLAESDVHEVLLRRGCLAYQGEDLRPTNAGILLFGKDPQRFVRGAEITAVRFAGEAMSDNFQRQDITGTLPDQIRRAETFLRDHLRKSVALSGMMARSERYEYPMEAARELVVNAVAHRDYSISGDSIRLFIFRDRMEVNNPGKLAGPMTIANIRDERFSRNPVIVQVLSDMGFIERLGYGVDRVIELMRSQNLKAPDFSEGGGGFKVTLFNTADETPGPEVTPPDRSSEFSRLLLEYRDIPLNPRQEAALEYLTQPENSRITNSELQSRFKDVHAETIRRDLADLVTKNILAKRGQKRGSYYVLRRNLSPDDMDSDDDADDE